MNKLHDAFSRLSLLSFVGMVVWIVISLLDLIRLHYGFTRGLPPEWIENPKLMIDISIYGSIAFFVMYIIFVSLQMATKSKIN